LKMRIATLSLLTILCLALGTTALAQGQIYNDGPTLGTTNAFFIDGVGGPFGQSISDGFFPTTSGSATDVSFAEWVLSGTTPTGVSYGIDTVNFGSALGGGVAGNFTTSLLCTNGAPYNGGLCAGGFGYDLYQSHFTFADIQMNVGTQYWLTLTGATDSGGTGFNGWDLNSGPATCLFEVGGIVPGGGLGCGAGGESFTISSGGTTPEPSSILLFGSGILGLAGVLRRKLTR
jgi:hypothetical protein